jgi:hypothetical protein
MIRLAVTREMSDDGGATGAASRSGPSADALDLDGRLTDIESLLRDVQRGIEGTETKVERVCETVERDRSLDQLAPDVYAVLPSGRSKLSFPEMIDDGENVKYGGEDHQLPEDWLTLEWVAREVGVDTDTAEAVLGKL